MEIAYLGHSAFRIKTKTGIVVMDPYNSLIGLKMPSTTADIVTISHRGHGDHDNDKAVGATTRRDKPFVIDEPGEYEIDGISIFGYQTFHDKKDGAERGENNIYVLQSEDLRILHLGDLGHELSEKLITELDGIDILMIPVGGKYTIDVKEAIKIAEKVDPYIVIPMHFRTDKHDKETFGEMAEVDEFTKTIGYPIRKVSTLNVTKLSLSTDNTEVVVFE